MTRVSLPSRVGVQLLVEQQGGQVKALLETDSMQGDSLLCTPVTDTLTEAAVAKVDGWWRLSPCGLWCCCQQRCRQDCGGDLAAAGLGICWC